MNIFLTGGSGFVGRSIRSQLSEKYSIKAPSSSELDLTNLTDLEAYVNRNDFQWIINCAVRGGRRTKVDTESDFYTNIKILDNLLSFVSSDIKLITFSSGAEIYNPTSFYGFSKKICTSLVKHKDYIKNLRIYNVFGELGMEDSFVYTCIKKCLANEDIVIWEDKLFDIYYINDLVCTIEDLIKENYLEYEEFDCVYEQKYKLSDIARLIKWASKSTSHIIIQKENGPNYIGTPQVNIKDGVITSYRTPLDISLWHMIQSIKSKSDI